MSYELKDTILYLENVELGYGVGSDYKAVLKDINIIEKDVVRKGHITGQTIAIIGRSGRGKSTLFKALTGLVKPKSGKILMTELSTEDTSDAKVVEEGDIGFVDQKYTLFRHKTVKGMLLYAMRKDNRHKEEKLSIIESNLDSWALKGHGDKYACELSGGQRQRVAILEQILSSRHFMVLDEPTSGLDTVGIDSVKDTFNHILGQDELNTIIFSTHLIEFAVQMADVIYFLGHPIGITDYSTIIRKIDMKERNLAWGTWHDGHTETVNEIKELMKKH